jgi:hypothetical protein
MRKRFAALPEPLRFLISVVGIPVACGFLLAVILIYLLGGTDLLRFAIAQMTWKLSIGFFCGIAVLALVTLGKHVFWYSNEKPPMWFRSTLWINILEFLLLLGVIVFGIWALQRFLPNS